MKLVTFKEYNLRYEAEMTIQRLKKQGIDAVLKSDDCGGLKPNLGFAEGYMVQVKEEDLDKAKKLIE